MTQTVASAVDKHGFGGRGKRMIQNYVLLPLKGPKRNVFSSV